MNYLIYKNYHGSIEYSKEDKLLFGKVLGIKSLISYEGKTGDKLEKDVKAAIDFYLSDCEEQEVEPEVAFKGSFNVRVPSGVHMALALEAKEKMTSLNNFVRSILEQNLNQRGKFFPTQQTAKDAAKKLVVSKKRSTVTRAARKSK